MSIERILQEFEVTIRWVAYPLNPYQPGGFQMRFSPDSAYDPASITEKTTQTRDAQELTKWAESKGKGESFRAALWNAIYSKHQDIGRPETLRDAAASAGLPEDEAAEILSDRTFKEAVDADWKRSLEIDPECVPSVLLGGELLVNPQGYDQIEELMERHRIKRRVR
ncbi:MAG: hypothetical protein C4530_23860 [Desulfobacteraceae bacterium]|nr:MAG: hypothetical protein C4530_23860 [Desulfobacteraceae bacterium]